MKQTMLGGLAISALLLAATLSTAYAADLPVKAVPPPAPVAATDWTGLYFDVGIGWQQNSHTWNTNFPGGPFNAVFSASTSGGSVAAHIGYQQQVGWLVVGGEVGALKPWTPQWTSTVSSGVIPGTACGFGIAGAACQNSIDSVSTAGGKLGVAWQDWLFYGVGGKAFGATLQSRMVFGGTLVDQWGPSNTSGWYAGGGVDLMLVKTRFGDLIGGIEYEHVNLNGVQEFSQNQAFLPGTFQNLASAKIDAVWAKLTLKLNPFGN